MQRALRGGARLAERLPCACLARQGCETAFLEFSDFCLFLFAVAQHNYPEAPPTLRFKSEFWHPNVYREGPVCISILHAAGDDQMSGESFDIRWKPINSVSSVLNSVLLMLMEPNLSSPANVDASVEWRDDIESFKGKAKTLAQRAQDMFIELHSDIWIPHPDTNPEERLLYNNGDDNDTKMTSIEVWGDSDGDDNEEWGSGEEMQDSD